MQCYSCMSPYLEDQFLYISHLYRKPLQFTERCDEARFNGDGIKVKNCSDMCVTLRMNDKVGGRRRHGYMRGCLSDILHYNRTVVRENPNCYHVRLRDLFVSSDRYSFEPTDNVMLCTCANKLLCNSGTSIIGGNSRKIKKFSQFILKNLFKTIGKEIHLDWRIENCVLFIFLTFIGLILKKVIFSCLDVEYFMEEFYLPSFIGALIWLAL
uniref:Caenorhabditis elegans ly-6-related family-containing protein n=1 Tax=Strongyloides papillosus TaxID=174720 RepID=A0A0N5BDZ9_STREA